jgi:mRNA deadenylase 3'-5' endonuclease subunit Ccr4
VKICKKEKSNAGFKKQVYSDTSVNYWHKNSVNLNPFTHTFTVMQNNILSSWLCKKHFYRKAKSEVLSSDTFVYTLIQPERSPNKQPEK